MHHSLTQTNVPSVDALSANTVKLAARSMSRARQQWMTWPSYKFWSTANTRNVLIVELDMYAILKITCAGMVSQHVIS